MRAWITTIRNDGIECIGSEHCTVTPEYKRLFYILKYANNYLQGKIKSGFANQVRIDIHYNWDTRYSNPDKTIILKG